MTTLTDTGSLPDVLDQICSRQAPATAIAGPGSLDVEDLRVTFGSKRKVIEAVRGVSFSVRAGSTLVLLGESGSGKSVTARSLLRLYSSSVAVTGTAALGSVDLLGLSERAMQTVRGKDLALVPQDASGSLDPLRHVGSQLVEVLRQYGISSGRKASYQRAGELLTRVGIPDPDRVLKAYPHELSGGMRQRALIAIAIAGSPKVLIADEPTTALDVTIQAQVLELFKQLQTTMGMGLLLVTHDVGVARQMADRVAVMYAGRLVEEGPAEEVLERPAHPYTAGLLAAEPTPETPPGQLQAIPGQPPAAGDLDTIGCAFAARCGFATDGCGNDRPPLVSIGPDHDAACPVTDGPVAVALATKQAAGSRP